MVRLCQGRKTGKRKKKGGTDHEPTECMVWDGGFFVPLLQSYTHTYIYIYTYTQYDNNTRATRESVVLVSHPQFKDTQKKERGKGQGKGGEGRRGRHALTAVERPIQQRLGEAKGDPIFDMNKVAWNDEGEEGGKRSLLV